MSEELTRAQHMELAAMHYSLAIDISKDSALDILMMIPGWVGDESDRRTSAKIRQEIAELRSQSKEVSKSNE